MKKMVKLVGIIVFVALIGFGLAMCDPGQVIQGGGGSIRPTKYCPTDKKLCEHEALCVDDSCPCHRNGIKSCHCNW
jgi:hypothetical protein